MDSFSMTNDSQYLKEIQRLQSSNIELTRQIAILQARLETLKPVTDHVDAMEAQIRADFEAECG